MCFEQRLARGAVHADDAPAVRAAVDHVLQRVEHERQPRDWNRSARSAGELVEGLDQTRSNSHHNWRRQKEHTNTMLWTI